MRESRRRARAPDRGTTPHLTDARELFDSKHEIETSNTSELVIALCGPIGSSIHRIADALREQLTQDFSYEGCHIIRLSEYIEKYTQSAKDLPAQKRIKRLIHEGDELRKKHGASILAEFAVSQIALSRQKEKDASDIERHKPRRVCHIINSIKNQEELEILKLVYRDMLYFVGVYSPLPARVTALENVGMSQAEIYDLIDQDSGEEFNHGQTVRETFPQADFFLRVDTDTDAQIAARVERFLHLILGTKVLTPTYSEKAMYLAASAAGNSACLSRQVGATVTDKDGNVIAVGWNDVPKFGGGLYEANPEEDPNGDRDRRCWNLEGGVCFNDLEKQYIGKLLIDELCNKGIVSEDKHMAAIQLVRENSKVRDLIEFSRSIHAEAHAILTAAQLGGDRIVGGKIFCTTYPCHSCARQIIAAGIGEVYYIEPYRKSLATKLHGDAITEQESDRERVRILPYDGVAPTRYLKLFRVPNGERKKSGKLRRVNPREASPRFDKTLESLPTLEAIIVKGLQQKNLLVVGEGDEEAR